MSKPWDKAVERRRRQEIEDTERVLRQAREHEQRREAERIRAWREDQARLASALREGEAREQEVQRRKKEHIY